MSVYAKLQSIQLNLNAPKGQYNKFGKYYYRSCEDILEAVKPLLLKENAALTIKDKLIHIGDRYYIEATAALIDIESGEKVENTAYGREEDAKKGMDASQITGSASSYARKYALNGLFCIDDVKDADTGDNTASDSKADKASDDVHADLPVTQAHIATLKKEMERTGVAADTLLKMCKIAKLEDMLTSQFVAMMTKFKKTPDKK